MEEERPVVLFLEDWHWSDEASQEVLGKLVDLVPAHALLVVVTYRPVYTAAWGHPDHLTSIRLQALEAFASMGMISFTFMGIMPFFTSLAADGPPISVR